MAQEYQTLFTSPTGCVSAQPDGPPAPTPSVVPMRISLTGRHLKDIGARVRPLVAAPVVEVGVDEAAAVSAMVAKLLDRPGEGERVCHVAAEVEAARFEATLEESLAFVGHHELR